MAYADYNFYQNTYKGTVLSSEDFENLSERASDYIAYYTSGRSDAELSENVELLVKKCTCSIAEVLSECGISDLSTGIKNSESVGSWHVNYASVSREGVARNGLMDTVVYDKIKMYLSRTGLLYKCYY